MRLICDVFVVYGWFDVFVNNVGVSCVIVYDDFVVVMFDVWCEMYEINVIVLFWLVVEVEVVLCELVLCGWVGCVVNVSLYVGVCLKGVLILYVVVKVVFNYMIWLFVCMFVLVICVNVVVLGFVDMLLIVDWMDV